MLRFNATQFTENVKILRLYSGLYIHTCEIVDSIFNLSIKAGKTFAAL